jgi:hypothetical protein
VALPQDVGSKAPEPEANTSALPAPTVLLSDEGAGAEGESSDDAHADEGRLVYTRTLAELYAAQGASKQAIEVLRHLQALNPSDSEISRRIAEIETTGGPVASDDDAAPDDDEVEMLAKDLAESGASGNEVESPFAWAEKEPETGASAAGPTIREYFDGLLKWEPREDA